MHSPCITLEGSRACFKRINQTMTAENTSMSAQVGDIDPESVPDSVANRYALPEFEARQSYPYGVLPVGIHDCDEQGLRECLVERFPESTTRPRIFESFLRFRRQLTDYGMSGAQWVDGSFVEGNPDPRDIDVVSICDYDLYNQIAGEVGEAITQLFDDTYISKANFDTDAFLVLSCAPDHPFYEQFVSDSNYWRNWFGRTRDIENPPGKDLPGHPKGIVRLMLGDLPLPSATEESRP
jgi:hypothetical protein